MRKATVCMWQSNDVAGLGTSPGLTVASLQRLKMEAHIPALADCDVRFVLKFFKTKLCGKFKAHVVLLHDNARPHTAIRSTHLLYEFGWEVLNNHRIARTSRPVIFMFFLHLKKFLSGLRQSFQIDREAELSVTQWFRSQAADFYDTGIQMLVPVYYIFQCRRWNIEK